MRQYDQALRFNPGDPYIYNLKSYSQFKGGDVHGASQTIARGIELDPTYDWGYLDWARYQCAAGRADRALSTISDALKRRGSGFRSVIKYFLLRTVNCVSCVPASGPNLRNSPGRKGQAFSGRLGRAMAGRRSS